MHLKYDCMFVQLMNVHPEKPFIRNKAAQVLALTFVMEYVTLWPKFFFDILNLVGLNPNGVDIYLRTLMAIDAEVVDRDILHSPEVKLAPLKEKSAPVMPLKRLFLSYLRRHAETL